MPPIARILLLEVFKRRVICAGKLHDVPPRFQLEIELRLPGLYQDFWIFDSDIVGHIFAVNFVEAFDDVQLIAVWMTIAVQPGAFVEADRVDN